MKFAIPAATALFLLTLANASQGAVVYLDLPTDALSVQPAHAANGAQRQHLALAEAEAELRHGGAQLPPRPMSTVPEQSAYSMLMIGLGLLGLHMRRQPQEEKFSVEAPQ
ncbi:hypothetical protein ACFDR9_004476 [Janthinobacterium sp. CG_23.3]|uniref:PEP-CTERM sorting domain-containing protein n=1 Tax=Janthinobacterium sp. CG_23.3 TaxID=3349634 RepID=UPI0038D4DD7C